MQTISARGNEKKIVQDVLHANDFVYSRLSNF